MKRLIKELDILISDELYYSALFLGLSLIDICSKIQYPNMQPIKKDWGKYNAYMKWIDTYFCPLFEMDADKPIISSRDMYTLRCKVTHEGTVLLSNDDCTRIIMTLGSSHRNVGCVSNSKSTIIEKQLNIRRFLEEILFSISKWATTKSDKELTLDFDIFDVNFSSTNLNGAQAFHNCN